MNSQEFDDYLKTLPPQAAPAALAKVDPKDPNRDQGVLQAILQGGVDAVPGIKQASAFLGSTFQPSGGNYDQRLKQYQLESEAAQSQHGTAHTVGDIGTSALEMLAIPGGGASKIVAPAVKSAILGGAQGASDANAQGYDAEDTAKQAALNAIVSGGLGAVGGAADAAIGKGIDRMRRAGVGLDTGLNRSGNTQLYDLRDPTKPAQSGYNIPPDNVPPSGSYTQSSILDENGDPLSTFKPDNTEDQKYANIKLNVKTKQLGRNNANNQINKSVSDTSNLVGKVVGNAVKGVLPGGGIGAIIGADSDPDDRLAGAIKGAAIGGIGGSLVEGAIPALEKGTTNIVKPLITGPSIAAGRLLGGQHLTPQGATEAIGKLDNMDDINKLLGFNLQDFKNNKADLSDLTDDPNNAQALIDDTNSKNAKITSIEDFLGQKLPVNFQSSLLINKNPSLNQNLAYATGGAFDAATQGAANAGAGAITAQPDNDTNPLYAPASSGPPSNMDTINQYLLQHQPGSASQLGSSN